MLTAALQASGVSLGGVGAVASRFLSVYAWGRNAEHQGGVELWDAVPLVPRPTPLLDLVGRDDIVAVAAGKLNSAALTCGGDVLTWGDGRSARLGHGGDATVASPSTVEALVGRADVVGVALGDQHSLFLDRSGGVWAVGSNLEGQVGTGAPISELARQQRRALYGSLHIEALLQRNRPGGSSGFGSGGGGGGRHEAYLRAYAEMHGVRASNEGEQHGWLSRARARHAASGGGNAARQSLAAGFVRPGGSGGGGGSSHYASSLGLGGGGSSGSAPGITSSGVWGIDIERHLHEAGAQPGVVPTPTRVERSVLAAASWDAPGSGSGSESTSPGSNSSSSGSSSSSAASGPAGRGLECERVVGVDCGRHFSIAVTESGEVWTWGASFTGALGQREVSWATAAAPIADSPLADAIAAEGGAVAVAAAGTGAACLTASGKVLLFGGLAAPPITNRPLPAATTPHQRDAATTAQRLGFAVAALPSPVKSIAAGQQHLVMTDGERLWLVGRWLDGDGQEAGAAPFWAPAEMLHLPAEGILKVVAGAHSTGAISGDGRLFLGGRLLDRHHAEALMHKHGAALPPGAIDWTWTGFGGATLAPVPGLPGVVDAALGGWHALVLAD